MVPYVYEMYCLTCQLKHLSVLHTLRRISADGHSRPGHHGHVLLLGLWGMPGSLAGLGNHAHVGVEVPRRDLGDPVGVLHLLLSNHPGEFALPVSVRTKERG